MIVVSDTSPITALLTVGQPDLLTRLFGEVTIPPAVAAELRRSHPVLPFGRRVESLQDSAPARLQAQIVDRGEAEAIALTAELQAEHLLIDERKGRRLAQQHGVPVVGLLGIVLMANRAQFIPSARAWLKQLDQEAGIYLTDELKTAALKTVEE